MIISAKPTYKLIKDHIQINGLVFKNHEDIFCYMFHNDKDVILEVNDWLLETFPAYYGMIEYGETTDLDGLYNSKRKYYAQIPIFLPKKNKPIRLTGDFVVIDIENTEDEENEL